MTKRNITISGREAIVYIPDDLPGRTGRDSDRAVWLLAPKGESASVWCERTKVEEYAETAKGLIICLPWVNDYGFYTGEAWVTMHHEFTRLSHEPNDNRMVGYADSAMRVLHFLFTYPELFRTGVSVCPEAGGGLATLAAAARNYMRNTDKEPRIAIADTPDGEAAAIGAAINAHGVGAHVYPDRPVGGWELVDAELKNCLAHL